MAAGLGVIALVLTALVWAVRLPVPGAHLESRQTQAPRITLGSTADADRVRQELLLDLEPLFLPTRHNTSVLSLPAQARREPGSMSFAIVPLLKISEAGGGVPLPEPLAVPPGPIAPLTVGEPPNPWPEVGRGDVDIPVFPARLGYLEVISTRSGHAVLSESIPASPSLTPPAADWAPLEFLIAIDPAGLVGTPVITGSTTSEEVETFFRNFVVKKLRLGARLEPGFYTVRVGP